MPTAVMEWSEAELIDGMLQGERCAWSAFSRRYEGLIYAAIDRVLRCFPLLSSRTEREEVHAALLSSLLARDMHKLRVFEHDRGVRLSTWIGLLATNAARDHVRAAVRRPSSTSSVTAFDLLEDGRAGPLTELLNKEAMAAVLSTIESLPRKDRQLVQLLFVQAQRPEQVAETMNISVKTVYTKKHKLIHRLQHSLRS